MAASVDLSELLITCPVMDTFGNLGDLTTCDSFHLSRWTSCRSGSPHSLSAAFSFIHGFLSIQVRDFSSFFLFWFKACFHEVFLLSKWNVMSKESQTKQRVKRLNQSDVYVLILDTC